MGRELFVAWSFLLPSRITLLLVPITWLNVMTRELLLTEHCRTLNHVEGAISWPGQVLCLPCHEEVLLLPTKPYNEMRVELL